MRISANHSDPAYTPSFPHYRVLLGNIHIDYCITADEEAGVILKAKCDSRGRLIRLKTGIKLETLKGRVRIYDARIFGHA